MTTKEKLEEEIEAWMDDIADEYTEAFLELQEITDDNLMFSIGEDEEVFTITYPSDYPNSKEDRFVFFTESDALIGWAASMNEYAEKARVKLVDLLNECCEKFIKISGKGEDEDEDLGLLGADEEVEETKKKPKKTQEELAIEKKMDGGGFLEIGSAQATLRIISDLKALKKQKPEDLGFSADPIVEPKSGLENLYHWKIKLFGVDKASSLYKDLQSFKKKSGHEASIELEMRFSKDYPHIPPFVRVVRPRFAFRTGHVTLGGSICMELLTNSGWNATNDIESILVQIMSELVGGGARLDANQSEYSEHEAWEAFYRAASTHGWNVGGLGKDMFPKV